MQKSYQCADGFVPIEFISRDKCNSKPKEFYKTAFLAFTGAYKTELSFSVSEERRTRTERDGRKKG